MHESLLIRKSCLSEHGSLNCAFAQLNLIFVPNSKTGIFLSVQRFLASESCENLASLRAYYTLIYILHFWLHTTKYKFNFHLDFPFGWSPYSSCFLCINILKFILRGWQFLHVCSKDLVLKLAYILLINCWCLHFVECVTWVLIITYTNDTQQTRPRLLYLSRTRPPPSFSFFCVCLCRTR